MVRTQRVRINVSIDISVQKEVIDKTGKSYWELVYFVSTNDTKETAAVLDSRVEEYKNVTTLLAVGIVNVTDVNGQSYKVMKSVDHLFRADQTFSLFLSAKFGKKEELKFKETIEAAVRKQLKVTMNTSITVNVLKHEEVTTGSYESAWKYLFSVKVDGRILNPMSSLNGSWPHFDLVTSTGHRVTTLVNQTETSYYNFRNSFSFYLEKNVSFSFWSEIKAALNRSWSTIDEYKTCACLDFDLGSIHEVIDSKGKTFYKVLYFMKQNATMVDAMTHRKLNTTILKSELKDIRSVQGQHNTVVEVTGDVTTREHSLFGFFLKAMVRIDHWSRMEKTIEKTYTMDNNTQECCTSVRLLRQIPFITINGQMLWKVEYQLLRQNITLDAEVTTGVNVTSLQSEIDVTFASGYVIEEVQQRQLIDYRNKVELYFSAPIAEEHFTKIKQAVNISYAVSVTDILILSNQEVIDISGNSFWELSVFIYEGDKDNVVPYVPGWGLARVTVNMTLLMTEVKNLKIAGVHGYVEMLEKTGEGLRLYEQSLSILVKSVIKTVDIVSISEALTHLWNTTLRESVQETTAVTVEVSRQDELVDIAGNTISRLVYFLKIGEETVTAGEVPSQNKTRIQATLTSLFKEKYQVVMETELTLLRYESLFAFYMASPVLLQDTHEFQDRLEVAWKIKFESNIMVNVTSRIRILLQEELTNGTAESKTLWRVLYSLERDSKLVDARSEIGLSVNEVKAVLDTEFYTTSTNYSGILLDVTVVETMYRYTDLFSLHIKHRVASIDYIQFETSLAAFWNHTMTGAVVSVCKQEEELDSHGESVWKLSYVIKKNNTVVSSQKIVQASADVIMKNVNVTSPRGMTYTIVDVTETVRIEEVYHLYVTRKVFRDDVTHFTETLQETIKDIVPENNLTGVQVEWKGQTQFKHITDSKLTAWRQLFLVKMNNKYITPLNYGSLNKEKITLNFTSIRGDYYDLINSSSLSVHYARADEQFSITVIGHIRTKDQALLKTAIQTSWNKTYINDSVTINIQSTEEYIGDNSIVVTRLSLFAVRGTSVIDPDTMITPSIHEVLDAISSTNGPSLVAYTGTTAIRYESCFTLMVKGTLKMAQQTNLQNVLKQAWQSKTGVNVKIEILIHKTEKFVGEFGVELTQVLYTVRINERLSQTDDDVPPSSTDIEAYQPDAMSSWKMYSGKVAFRLEAMYSIKVESLMTREVTSQQLVKLETALLSVWTQQHRNDCLSCQIRVVSGTSYRGYNSSAIVRVTEVSYTVTRNSDVITPWVMSSPTRANIAGNIDSQSAGVSVWLRPTYKVRDLYLIGYTSKIDMDRLRTGIHSAWLGSLGQSTNVSGEISDVNVYVDKQWQKLTKVQYFVSLNSTDPDQLTRSAPSTDEVSHALNNTGIQQHPCSCEGLKLRKMHVKGARVNYTAAAAALKQAWIDKNNASSSLETSLEVNLKQLQITRTRRAAAPAVELVDDQGKPVSRADYTVSIDGQDPEPLFVQPPSQDDLDRSLKANGIENCNCQPGKVGHVKLKGTTKEVEKKDVAEAVKDAIAKSNPDVNPADLDVQILDVDNHDEKGGPVSDIKYAVRRHDNDELEALSSPSEAHLSEALRAKGKALANTEETSQVPPPAENTDWQVPTAVLCSLFAFIVICIAVFYFVYVRRRRKNADLKEAEENIENNIHNEEHFAKPVVFNNPMYGTHQAKHVTVGTEGL
ncbi:uncharacterized protein LOC124275345 isoform X4 [Haliotis rubra]|uniref:uncharacterized protein LOC124275345 isoform X4 n=1 Tax=Haliotis rubra TaxID=36100 RepID=UPI001EE5A6C5|nr:uncharacterized protein LOC124275345 isoform X4 [Haliotis rubra]